MSAGPSTAAAPTPAGNPAPSKRDKRRNALSDRLSELSISFDRDRDHHYLNQVHALRQDYAAITSADTSGRDMRLLGDTAEEIDYVVTGGVYVGGGPGENGALNRAMGLGNTQLGGYYASFVQDINEKMEERDVGLAILHQQYHAKLTALKTTHERNLHHAREEHLSLAITMKQRLINRLYNAKKKLAADKEILDVSDTHALLHHPNQYSIGSAAGGLLGSPGRDSLSREGVLGDIFGAGGGMGSRRKLRQRKSEADELLLGPGGLLDVFTGGRAGEINANGEAKSQRRKARAARYNRRTGGAGDDDEEMDLCGNGVATPYGNSGNGNAGVGAAQLASLLHKQQTGPGTAGAEDMITKPVWAIEKLFTERELQMAGSLAALATVKYFSARKEKRLKNKDGGGSGADSDDDAGGTDGSRTPPSAEDYGIIGLGLTDWMNTPLAPSPAMTFGSTLPSVPGGVAHHNTRSHYNPSTASVASRPSNSSWSRLPLNNATHNHLINVEPQPTLQHLSFMTPSVNGYGTQAWSSLGVPAAYFSASSGSVANTTKAVALCAPTPQGAKAEEAEADLELIRKGVQVEIEVVEVEEGVEKVLLEMLKNGEGWGGRRVRGTEKEAVGLGLMFVGEVEVSRAEDTEQEQDQEQEHEQEQGGKQQFQVDDATDSQATIGEDTEMDNEMQEVGESGAQSNAPVATPTSASASGRGSKRARVGNDEKEISKKARTLRSGSGDKGKGKEGDGQRWEGEEYLGW